MAENEQYYRYGQSLSHHGIIGQRWGRRRYQNPDGSLTAAGKERYGVGDGSGAGDYAGTSKGAASVVKPRRAASATDAVVAQTTGYASAGSRVVPGTPKPVYANKQVKAENRELQQKRKEEYERERAVEKRRKENEARQKALEEKAKEAEEKKKAAEEKKKASEERKKEVSEALKKASEEQNKNGNEKGQENSKSNQKNKGNKNPPKETEIPDYRKDAKGIPDKELNAILDRYNKQKKYNDTFDPDKIAEREAEKTRKALEKHYTDQKAQLDSTKSILNASSSLANSTSSFIRTLPNDQKIIKAKKVDLSGYSNQELQAMITRANLERQWNQTFNPDKVVVNKGRERTLQMLETGAAALNLAGSAVGVASAITDLKSKRV